MLGNPMLDVALGLVFLYTVLSIIVTVLQEFLAATFNWRASNLEKAIIELIGEPRRRDFYTHPLIFPLFRGNVDEEGKPLDGGPSYIPPRSFALAVMDLQKKAAADARQPSGRNDTDAPAVQLARFIAEASTSGQLAERVGQLDRTATELLEKVQNESVRQALGETVAAAVDRLQDTADVVDVTVRELEGLFDNTMNRAAGWYKKQSQRIALGLSLALAVLLNADSLYIAQRLWEDDALRARAVAAAQAFYQSSIAQEQLAVRCGAPSGDPGSQMTAKQWQAVRECTHAEIASAVNQIVEAGYPMGWPMPPDQSGRLAILGFLITALALSLGSSFWFDLLGKFMNVRMSGKREEPATPRTSNRAKAD